MSTIDDGGGWRSDPRFQWQPEFPDDRVPPNASPNARYTYNSERYPSSTSNADDNESEAPRSPASPPRNRWTTPMSPFPAQINYPPVQPSVMQTPATGYIPPLMYQYPASYPASFFGGQQTINAYTPNTQNAFMPLNSPGRTDIDWPPADGAESYDARQRYPASPYPYNRRAFSNNAIDQRVDGEWDAWPPVALGTPGEGFGYVLESPTTTLVRSASAMGGQFGYSNDTGMRTGPRPRHKRPDEWREDYRPPRNGWAKLFNAIGRRRGDSGSITRNLLSFMGKSQLHLILEFRSPAPVHWDLRQEPTFLRLNHENRPCTFIELGESATDPPSDRMEIIHPDLPWVIFIDAPTPAKLETQTYFPSTDLPQWSTAPPPTLPHLITISHMLWSTYTQLRVPIVDADFYADDLKQVDRERISNAWRERCKGNEQEARNGVRRVDYFGEKFILEGFAKKRDGVWEMKTRRKMGAEK